MNGSPDRRASVDAGGDAARTARLIFAAELSGGAVTEDQVLSAEVLRAVGPQPVAPLPVRVLEAARKSRNGFSAPTRGTEPHLAARRAVLGAGAQAPPRFLVRVDEFPHYLAWDDPDRYGSGGYLRFHEIMRAAGVAYLVAGLPRLSRRPLDPAGREWRPLSADEVAVIGRVRREGAVIALHGRDHRTRSRSPRRRSELCGLDADRTAALLDEGLAELEPAGGGRPEVFVAPYNRFDARQWPILARRFAVVGGGPESIRLVGRRPAPQWWDGAVYLPAYAPFYGTAAQVLPAVQRSIAAGDGLWTPIVLHWGWEADAGWKDLKRLATVLAPYVAGWDDFLAAVRRSR